MEVRNNDLRSQASSDTGKTGNFRFQLLLLKIAILVGKKGDGNICVSEEHTLALSLNEDE